MLIEGRVVLLQGKKEDGKACEEEVREAEEDSNKTQTNGKNVCRRAGAVKPKNK